MIFPYKLSRPSKEKKKSTVYIVSRELKTIVLVASLAFKFQLIYDSNWIAIMICLSRRDIELHKSAINPPQRMNLIRLSF